MPGDKLGIGLAARLTNGLFTGTACAGFTGQVGFGKATVDGIGDAGRQLAAAGESAAAARASETPLSVSSLPVRAWAISKVASAELATSRTWVLAVAAVAANAFGGSVQFGERSHAQNHRRRLVLRRRKLQIGSGFHESELADFDAIVPRGQAGQLEFPGLVGPAHPALVGAGIGEANGGRWHREAVGRFHRATGEESCAAGCGGGLGL